MMEIEEVHRFVDTIPGVSPHLEGPHLDDSSNTLLNVDILKKDEKVGFVVPASKGGLIAGLGLTLSHVDWETKKVTCLHKVNEAPTSQFNDGKCDPIGRVWSGTYGEMKDNNDLSKMEHIGHLYSMDVYGCLTDRLEKIGISNGLGWTKDSKTMFFIDSIPRKVSAFDYDVKDGSIENQRTIVQFKGTRDEMGEPDGMTLDLDRCVRC